MLVANTNEKYAEYIACCWNLACKFCKLHLNILLLKHIFRNEKMKLLISSAHIRCAGIIVDTKTIPCTYPESSKPANGY